MKHILLGTTALVAAGLMAGPAAAQEGVKLGLGGFYFGAVGGNFDEDGTIEDQDELAVRQSVEVHFKGEATLDNGLTVGSRIELEANHDMTGDDRIDEVFSYFSGGFGELRIGADDDAYAQLCYVVPTASAAFGADSPFISFSNADDAGGYAATNGTCYGLSGDAAKVIYFTPSFGGFQLAASYAPDGSTLSTDFGTDSDEDGDVEDIFGAAATYVGEFGGFNLVAGGGGSWGSREDTAGVSSPYDDPSSYNGYLQVGFGGLTVGGATELRKDFITVGSEAGDAWVYGVGATYGFEAWTVGLGWTRGEYDTQGGDGDEDKHDTIQFTAAYALGPGVTLDAMVGYEDYTNNNQAATGGDDYNAISAAVGFGISF